jgi:hypothetical protein
MDRVIGRISDAAKFFGRAKVGPVAIVDMKEKAAQVGTSCIGC